MESRTGLLPFSFEGSDEVPLESSAWRGKASLSPGRVPQKVLDPWDCLGSEMVRLVTVNVRAGAQVRTGVFCPDRVVAPAWCVGETLPDASNSSTSCSAKNKFSAAEGWSFRSPSSRKLRVQGSASWNWETGDFFQFSWKEKQYEAFLSFLTLLCQKSDLLKGKTISPLVLNLLLK